MAKDNLNKTEKNKIKTTTAWKLITLGIIINKIEIPLFRQKSTSNSKLSIVKQNLHHNNQFLKILRSEVWKGWF